MGGSLKRSEENGPSDRVVAGWVGLLLAAVYLLLFSGRFHSIDEVSSVALADTMVTEGRAHTDQIGWSQSWPLPQGAEGQDGHLYSKKGIGLSLVVAPLQAAARLVPGVGAVGMAMLTNIWVTALTGALLYALARRLDYTLSSSLFVALAWGLATLAPVYSKTLFNSPLVALLFVAALWLLLPRGERAPSVGALLLAGGLLGWALLTRAENALVVPLFAAWVGWLTADSWRKRVARLAWFGAPIALVVLFLFWFNAFRFGDPLNFGYDLSQEANGNVAVGLLGILLSPGRSIFVYMLLLVLAPLGLWRMARSPSRARQGLGWLVGGLTVVYFLFFARSADWWGGWNWGIRYLLPLLPLWCLGLAPLWEAAPWRRGLLALACLSGAIQLLGGLVDFNRPLLEGVQANVSLEQQLWNVRHSQILAHLRLVPNWQQWDIALVATRSHEAGLVGILLILLAAWGLRRGVHGQSSTVLAGMVSAGLLLFALLTQFRAYHDPIWQTHHSDLEPLRARLEAAPPNSLLLFEMLLTDSYFNRAQAWLNLNTSEVPHRQFIQQTQPPVTVVRAARGAMTIFLATENTPPGSAASGTERWLSGWSFFAGSEWIGPTTRLVRFEQPPLPAEALPAPVALEDGIVLARAAFPAFPLAPGEVLPLHLRWQATRPPTTDYTVFVQLLGPDGVITQQDSWPQAGFAPTSTWQADTIVDDRRALLLPPMLPPGDYSLIAGLYDATGQRLPLATGGDFIPLGTIVVQ